MNELVLEPEWPVTWLGTVPNAVVIVTLPSGGTAKETGSDQTSLPWAMVTVSVPEKARALSVVVSMVLSTRGVALHSAMCADLIVTEPLPKRWENCTRSWLPPIETCVIWRITPFDNDAGGGLAES